MNKRIAIPLFALTVFLIGSTGAFAAGGSAEKPVNGETVILLHGILNTPMFMKNIETALSRAGYHVLNIGYPSREKTIEQHAGDLHPIIRSVPEGNVIHFVGFSLGSQIIRYYLKQYPVPKPGRFVMIAPPNHGSEMADYFYRFEWFPWLYGTASGPQLKASNRAFFDSLGKPPIPFGIIAGGRGDKTGRNPLIPGDDDGTVSVESARLEGAEDFILIDSDHTAILFLKKTVEYTVSFLKTGKFEN